ncbi:MAG: class A beta-lactamase-related serine hydrolase [Spartobacteria bacterium]|nr:class A beta-lactamase-related serine hydrolase [Spartobacteria bacterium]
MVSCRLIMHGNAARTPCRRICFFVTECGFHHNIQTWVFLNLREVLMRLNSLFSGFPMIGTFAKKSSNHWNFYKKYFQPLELSRKKVPIIGTFVLGLFLMAGQGFARDVVSYTNTIAAARAGITNLMAEKNIPGCTIVLVEGQRVVWAEGFGYANLETQTPVTTNTVMAIGSVSKLLTTMMALQLVDTNAFDLDACITNYLPGVSMLPRFAGQTEGWTLRSLLDHHSGLPGDIYNGAFVTGVPYWPGYTRWVMDYFHDDYPLYPPGLQASYCNSGFNLVGEAIGVNDGVDFTVSAENRIFTPLNMPFSSFLLDKTTVTNNLATGYNADGSPSPDLMANMPATGGAFSRPLDMANIIKMILADGAFGGGDFLSTNALAQMGTFKSGPLDVDNFFKPGLGLDSVDDPVLKYAGRTWLKNGSTSKFESLFEVLPDQQLGAFVNINCANSMTFAILRAVLTNAVLEKSGLSPTNVPPMPDVAETNWSFAQLQAVEGYYATKEGVDRFVAQADGSLTRIPNAQSETASVTNVRPHVNGRFYVPGSPELQLAFTNIAGYDVVLRYGSDGGVRDTVMYGGYVEALLGTRYTPPPISAAWSNRCDTFWMAENILVGDSFAADGNPSGCMLSVENGMLSLLSSGGSGTLAPTNDTLAFIAGLSTRGDSCVRVETNAAGQERLWFGGYRCVRLEDIPVVTNGARVNVALAMHTNALFRYMPEAAGERVALSLDAQAADAVLRVISLAEQEVVAQGTGTVSWVAGDGPSVISISCSRTVESDATLSTVNYSNTIAQITDLVNGYVTNGDLVGLSLSLVDEHGIIWSEGFGWADREQEKAADGDSIYRLASLSKIFASVATLREQEQGRVALDAAVTNYVSSFAPKVRIDGNMPAIDYATDPVTVRSLLDHMSGIQNAYTPYSETSVVYSNFLDLGIASAEVDYGCLPVDFLVSYNNNGFQFAEYMVQQLTGVSFADYMQTYFFDPLGMTNTGYDMDALAATDDLAASYFFNKEAAPREYMNCLGTGGALSSANDMARFLQMVIRRGQSDAGQILSENTVCEMISDQTTNSRLYVGNKGLATGLGWDSAVLAELDYAGGGCSKFGSIVTYGTYTAIATNQNLGIFVGVNTPSAGMAISLGNKLLQKAVEDKTGLTVPDAPALPSSPFVTGDVQSEVQSLAGYYVNGAYTEIAAGLNCLQYNGTPVYLREDGWWSASNAPTYLLGFTNVDGFVFSKVMQASGNYLDTSVTGLRYQPQPMTNAWADRLDTKWLIASLPETSYNRTHDGLMTATLRQENGMLIMALPTIFTGQSDSGFYNRGDFVLDPYSDDIAFVQGSGYTIPGSVEMLDGGKRFRATNYEWQRMDSIPKVSMPLTTNITPDGDSLELFAFDAVAGVEYFVQLGSGVSGTLMVSDADGNFDGDGMSGTTLRWTCPSNGTYYAGIHLPADAPANVPMQLYNYAKTIAQVEQMLEYAWATGEFVGGSWVLVDGDQIIKASGVGYADRENEIPATADTVYRIGSVSKLFTTVATLQEVDKGTIELDAAVTNYLSHFNIDPRPDSHLPPIDYTNNPITVRSLLNHLSGLPSTYMRHAMTTEPKWRIWDDYLTEAMEGIQSDYGCAPVNFFASYNNNGFVLAEYLLGNVTGQSLASYAKTNLFGPLNMSRTGFDMDDAALTNGQAKSYNAELELMPKEYVNCLGAGGALTTANDMGSFLKMLLAKGRASTTILQTNTVLDMMSDQTADQVLSVGNKAFATGLGWDSALFPYFEYAGGGCEKNGETTTFAAYTALATNQNLGVFVVKNSPKARNITELARYILETAIEDKCGLAKTNEAAIPPSPFVQNTQTNVDALAGYYVNNSGYVNLKAGTNCLMYGRTPQYLRADGWYGSATNAEFLIGFTNVQGRIFTMLRMAYEGYVESAVTGERYDPPVITNVWSNRMDQSWLILSLPDVSYMRTHPCSLMAQAAMTNGLMTIAVPSIMLDDYSFGYDAMTPMVIDPYNDELAFVQGVGGKMPCAVRADDDIMVVDSYYWKNTKTVPHLTMSSPTNMEPSWPVTDWFSFDAEAGTEYFLNLGGSMTGVFMLVDSSGMYQGDGTSDDVLRWTCPTSGLYYAGINFPHDAPAALTVSLYNYTNTIAQITDLITQQMDAEQVTGVSIALLDDQDVVWAQGFGYADKEAGRPVTTNSVFHIGSCSKAFTAATALQFIDKGTLNLDAAITNYIPNVSWKERYALASQITVRDLLDMHSGLPGDLLRNGFTTEPLTSGYADNVYDLSRT